MAFIKSDLRLVYLKFDKDAYLKNLKETLEKENRQAARAWLRAIVLDHDLPPVWTGEARGSLRPLGQFLRVAIPIKPSNSKGALYAMAHGHTAEAGAAQGHFKLGVEGKARVVFEFSTDVVHYFINEFYNVKPPIHLIKPGPYHSFEKGKKAYDAYIKENLFKNLPKLHSYIRKYIETTHE